MSIEVYTNEDGEIRESTGKVMQFPAGEQHYVRDDLEIGPVAIVVRGASSEDLMSAAMVSAAFHDMARQAFLVIPYLPGARQDRGVPFGAKVYSEFIRKVINPDKILTVDPHSEVMPELLTITPSFPYPKSYGVPSVYPAARAVSRAVATRTDYGWNSPYVGIIAPDAGARGRAESVARKLELPLYQALKHRDFDTGKLSGFSCEELPSEGKLLVVDDICDGGGTFNGLAEVTGLGKDRLDLWVTHGVFSGRAPSLREHFGQIHTTDSHPGHSNPEVGAIVHPIVSTLVREALTL